MIKHQSIQSVDACSGKFSRLSSEHRINHLVGYTIDIKYSTSRLPLACIQSAQHAGQEDKLKPSFIWKQAPPKKTCCFFWIFIILQLSNTEIYSWGHRMKGLLYISKINRQDSIYEICLTSWPTFKEAVTGVCPIGSCCSGRIVRVEAANQSAIGKTGWEHKVNAQMRASQ